MNKQVKGEDWMDDMLYSYLYESFRTVQNLVHDFPVNNNPLELRLAPLYNEMQDMLWQALYLLHNKPFEKDQFKSVMSIIYRNNEAFNPLLGGWVRASKWMKLTPSKKLAEKKLLSKHLQYYLKQTAPYIQQLYGKEEARFIIPPLLRSEETD